MARNPGRATRCCSRGCLATLISVAAGAWFIANNQQSFQSARPLVLQASTAAPIFLATTTAAPIVSTALANTATSSTADARPTLFVWELQEFFPDPTAPVIYIQEHIDGAGHRLRSICEGIGVAAKLRLNFGGVVPTGSSMTEHGHDFRRVVDDIFGENASKALFPASRPNFSQKIVSVQRLTEARPDLAPGALLYFPNPNSWAETREPARRFFPPALRSALRSRLDRRPLEFVPGRLWVALHLRCGDLPRTNFRVTPNEYYYDLLKSLRREFPQADVHLWSSVSNYEGRKKHPMWSRSDFEGFIDRGVTLHLDDKSLVNPWAHMARAHVFLSAYSDFSLVPAMMNVNCVVYPGLIHRSPLQGWVFGKVVHSEAGERELNDCFDRAREARDAALGGSPQQFSAASAPAMPPEDSATTPNPAPPVPVAVTATTQVIQVIDESASREIKQQIANVSQARRGLYRDKAARPEFAGTLLLTSVNFAYLEIYDNWRCFAERSGLDWAVIANDDASYEKLGPGRAVPVLGEHVSGMHGWGSAGLDSLGRNKYVMLWQIMNITGLDIVFCDADNVFRSDPFQPGVSLGDLIRSRRYDYLFQEELVSAPNPNHKSPGEEGNTGLFYVAGSRKPPRIQAFVAGLVEAIDSVRGSNSRGLRAEQHVFWKHLTSLRRSHAVEDRSGFLCVSMCGQEPTCSAAPDAMLEYCNLNPWHHPTGWTVVPREAASYHANYVAGDALILSSTRDSYAGKDKILKLRKAGLWVQVGATNRTCPQMI